MAPTADDESAVREDEAGLLRKTPPSVASSYVNGVPNLCHPKHIGLMITYAGVGILHGAFPRTVYPFFRMYLNMDGYQVAACTSIIDMAWSFKVFFGLVSDSVPVWGFRRRPYVLLGWLIALGFMLHIANTPTEAPYYVKGQILSVPNVQLRRVDNPHAPADGTKYILLLMGASMGYVMADVACDAAMVELAQTEREDVRGHTQSWSYIIKYVFNSLATGIVGVVLNGPEYGGAFSWSISFNALMWALCCVVLAVLPAVLVFPDNIPDNVSPLSDKCRDMFAVCTQRAIWQTMWFQYLNGFFLGFDAAPSSVVASDWAHVEPINDSIFSMASTALMAFGMVLTNWYFLDADWRVLVALTTVAIVAVDSFVSALTIGDIVRNQWFYLGAPVLNNLPQGIRFVVSGFVTVEVTDAGHEGATYGLVTTVGNLATPLASAASSFIDGFFHVYQTDIDRDTPDVRNRVAYTYGIAYAMKLTSLVTLLLLPAQKRQAQTLKREGGRQPWIGTLTLAVTGLSLVVGVGTNLLAILPATSCMKMAGGPGCNPHTSAFAGW
ncbi:hypothetical protein H310_05109 [Aphanomyces invadans]|uniref:Transmembrane protein n=1 Tax=Aphanomyces invadans TaxID=157072 RepID=A0A024UDL8_9STRA|nr:hypothetical protein H310_05109 [Aphanomyces invadans]ETW03733.1 hypothetical protein H310_05109 [Aphanomyces invadans]|eukprot:XP_008867962.1 hypothetical protein H310_05109 [Aphanomyces invadans]